MTDWLSAFLLLPQQCLGKPHRGTTSRETKRLANQLKFVINAQRAADERDAADQLDNARHNAASAAARAPRRAPPIDPDDAQDRRMRHKIELSNSLVKRGFLSRGCKQLSAGKICPPTPETLQRLKALHPAAPAGRQLPAPPANAPVIVVEPELLAAILKKHIVNGAAPGCSGLSGELLAPLVEDPTCLSGLAGIVEDICNNDLGEHARQLLLQSKLLAFVKPDSDKPRPIAIGEVLYKLATAYGLEMANQKPAHGNPGDDGVSSVLRAVFDVIQLGIGVPGGAELAFHILQARLETIGPNGAALLADIENAFNSRDRAVMLEELYAEPRLMFLWNLAAFGYGGNATSLVYLLVTPHIASPRPKAHARGAYSAPCFSACPSRESLRQPFRTSTSQPEPSATTSTRLVPTPCALKPTTDYSAQRLDSTAPRPRFYGHMTPIPPPISSKDALSEASNLCAAPPSFWALHLASTPEPSPS